ncbi:MAG: hypothetical protein ACOX6T_09895 [Myxococcales bacterium]|jgi:hypothetical protein
MRSLFVSILAVGLLSGCVVHRDSSEDARPVARSGDITFLWSLGGRTCAQAPEVRWIHVTLTGTAGVEALENDGYFNCRLDGSDGIKLKSFSPGTYAYTIDAIDPADRVLYTASGTLAVNGDVVVSVTLNPLITTSALEVSWTFGAQRLSCAEAGITSEQGVSDVIITIGSTSHTVPCTFGGGQSAVFDDLAPGTHHVTIEGLIGDRLWYRGLGSITIAVGGSYQLPIQLDPVAAGATFVPVMSDGTTPFDCAATGATALQIQLYDKDDNCFPEDPLAPGGCGFNGSCEAFATAGFYFDYIPAGDDYVPGISAWKAGWTAVIKAWGRDATDIKYEGSSGTVVIVAGLEDQRELVRMLAK